MCIRLHVFHILWNVYSGLLPSFVVNCFSLSFLGDYRLLVLAHLLLDFICCKHLLPMCYLRIFHFLWSLFDEQRLLILILPHLSFYCMIITTLWNLPLLIMELYLSMCFSKKFKVLLNSSHLIGMYTFLFISPPEWPLHLPT